LALLSRKCNPEKEAAELHEKDVDRVQERKRNLGVRKTSTGQIAPNRKKSKLRERGKTKGKFKTKAVDSFYLGDEGEPGKSVSL